jgi:hypothetical protein
MLNHQVMKIIFNENVQRVTKKRKVQKKEEELEDETPIGNKKKSNF